MATEVWAKESLGNGPDDQYRQPRRQRQHAGHGRRDADDEPRGSRSAPRRAARNGSAPFLYVVSAAADKANGYRFDANLWHRSLPAGWRRPPRRLRDAPAAGLTEAGSSHFSGMPARRRPTYIVLSLSAVNCGFVCQVWRATNADSAFIELISGLSLSNSARTRFACLSIALEPERRREH